MATSNRNAAEPDTAAAAAGTNVEFAGTAQAAHDARGNVREAAQNRTDLDDAAHPEDYGYDPNDPTNVAARENAAAKRRQHVAALEHERDGYKKQGLGDRVKEVEEQIKLFTDGDGKTRTG